MFPSADNPLKSLTVENEASSPVTNIANTKIESLMKSGNFNEAVNLIVTLDLCNPNTNPAIKGLHAVATSSNFDSYRQAVSALISNPNQKFDLISSTLNSGEENIPEVLIPIYKAYSEGLSAAYNKPVPINTLGRVNALLLEFKKEGIDTDNLLDSNNSKGLLDILAADDWNFSDECKNKAKEFALLAVRKKESITLTREEVIELMKSISKNSPTTKATSTPPRARSQVSESTMLPAPPTAEEPTPVNTNPETTSTETPSEETTPNDPVKPEDVKKEPPEPESEIISNATNEGTKADAEAKKRKEEEERRHKRAFENTCTTYGNHLKYDAKEFTLSVDGTTYGAVAFWQVAVAADGKVTNEKFRSLAPKFHTDLNPTVNPECMQILNALFKI